MCHCRIHSNVTIYIVVLLWKCYSYAAVPSRYYGNATNSLLCNRHCYVTMETPNMSQYFSVWILPASWSRHFTEQTQCSALPEIFCRGRDSGLHSCITFGRSRMQISARWPVILSVFVVVFPSPSRRMPVYCLKINPRPRPSKFLSIHHPLITLLFNAMLSKLQKNVLKYTTNKEINLWIKISSDLFTR
jgi:hypothetical protein